MRVWAHGNEPPAARYMIGEERGLRCRQRRFGQDGEVVRSQIARRERTKLLHLVGTQPFGAQNLAQVTAKLVGCAVVNDEQNRRCERLPLRRGRQRQSGHCERQHNQRNQESAISFHVPLALLGLAAR